MLKLTRFLYNEQEVKLSLIASLLTKKSILECYYWFSELYYSKIDICSIIWEIYFDYYAFINPKLEYYITKKINEWNHENRNEIIHLLFIIKNMHILKHDSNVFLLRQISLIPDLCQNYIYIKKNKSNKEPIRDSNLHSLVMSIKEKNWVDICYYLKKILLSKNRNYCITSLTIYETIIDSFSLENKVQLREIWNSRIDNMDFHYILKFICSLKMDKSKLTINKKAIYVSPLNEDILEIKDIDEEIIQPIYKTLPYKRRYKIDSNIGSFDLNRFKISNYKKENYNWEYYASFTPLWKERIFMYNGSINHELKRIDFDNDDNLEMFYEKYGYELDEQSKDVQDCSLLDVKRRNHSDWLKYIEKDVIEWGMPTWIGDYELPDNFTFVV